MVFGSPKNRQRGNMSLESSESLAIPFFGTLGEESQKYGIEFCIEPNAPQYGCDFVTTADEGIRIVEQVNTKGFSLHLDTGCMTLAVDNIANSIRSAKELLRHFHVSNPMLAPVDENTDIDHSSAALALRDIDYKGYVSIEMRPQQSGNYENVKAAIEYTEQVYQL
jgi:sugar phosphate isomerase/epimerase